MPRKKVPPSTPEMACRFCGRVTKNAGMRAHVSSLRCAVLWALHQDLLDYNAPDLASRLLLAQRLTTNENKLPELSWCWAVAHVDYGIQDAVRERCVRDVEFRAALGGLWELGRMSPGSPEARIAAFVEEPGARQQRLAYETALRERHSVKSEMRRQENLIKVARKMLEDLAQKLQEYDARLAAGPPPARVRPPA